MMISDTSRNTALFLGLLIAMQGCATLPAQLAPVAPAVAPQPQSSASTESSPRPPAVPEVPQAATPQAELPSKVLIGKTYMRAYAPPKLLDKQWRQLLRMDLGSTAGDFFLLGNGQQRLAVFARKGRKIKGKTHEYTIIDELQLPESLNGMPIARCAWRPNTPKSVLAAFSDAGTRTPAWAVTLSTSGTIQLLLGGEQAALSCKETPRLLP